MILDARFILFSCVNHLRFSLESYIYFCDKNFLFFYFFVQVVFAGFSAESLSQRILDCKPNIILTTSAVKRAAKIVKLKDIVDDALQRAADNGHTVGEYLFKIENWGMNPIVPNIW